MSAPRPASEQRFATLFEQAPFSVQLLSVEGRTLQVNQAWKDLWGSHDGDPLLAFVLTEYNMLEDAQLEAKGVTTWLRRAFAGEAVRLPATYYDPAELGKQGRARWVEATARPIKDGAGQVLEVMLIHHDVTERVLSERELRASELRLKQLANTIPQLAWIADRHGNIDWYNERWYAYTGTTPEQMQGEGWRALHDPRMLPAVVELWQRSLATGEPFQMTFPLRGADGRYRPFFTLVAPMKDAAGSVMNWFGTNTDVSSLHDAEQERRDGERRKDEFLAMLAHELRNPLAPIGNAAQLLRMPGLDPARAARAGEIIERQVRHMTKLVDELLDVSRVTRGLITLQMETLDLETVVAGALEQLEPLLQASGHRVTRPAALDGTAVRGDRTRLIQVLVNLLGNAVKYSPPGSAIALRCDVDPGAVRVSVCDEGIGIEADFLPHVFELFTQATRTPDRAQGGLGIGLALVKSLVAMHGGEVTARSSGPGQGSCFVVSLPLADRSLQPAPSPAGAPRIPGLPPRCLRIMLVDDNTDAADSLAALLTLEGHEVRTAPDAATALAQAPRFNAQVYILDIGLPNMDGYELARRLKAQLPLQAATYIALTGYGQARDRELSSAAGFDLHLVKPLGPEALQQVLRRLGEVPAR